MIALKVLEVKGFMTKLLKEQTFEIFEVRGISITSFTKIEISCFVDKEYFSEEDETLSNYCKWKQLRQLVFFIIKGEKPPKKIKIVFSLPNQLVKQIHKNAASCSLNLVFENREAYFTVASSEKVFSVPNSLEKKEVNAAWVNFALDFFKSNNIIVSTLECWVLNFSWLFISIIV